MRAIPEESKAILQRQGYHLVGEGAVKPCLWLKRSLRGGDQCYKHHFYGISSHRCVQMTPTLSCNHRCMHCWRPVDDPFPISDTWTEPKDLMDGILKEQSRLLSGYGGSDVVDMDRLEEARRPAHAAVSLMGEPTMYPYLKDLLFDIHRRGMTSFVVSNGTHPNRLESLTPTQLYLSLNAPNRDIYEKEANPVAEGLWDRILASLEMIDGHPSRTVIRLTLAKGLNMLDARGYSDLLEMAQPDFIEVKAYMHLGKSRDRLSRDSMPTHQEVLNFARDIASHLSYDLEDEVPLSRVVLLSNGHVNRFL